MKNPQHQYSMSVAATILLGLASFAAAQTSSFKDPLTGEPIPLIKRSDIRMPRRKIQATCPESIDAEGDSYYHPTLDPDKMATCTNSNEYPMIWKEIPMTSNIPQYISSTGQECCDKFYVRQGVPAGTCRIEDVCNPPEIILGLWHSSKYDPTTCTNSGDYPVSWKDETLRQYHLFETSAKCCAEVKKKQVRHAMFWTSRRNGVVTNGILPLKKTRTILLSIPMARVPIQGLFMMFGWPNKMSTFSRIIKLVAIIL